MWKISINKKLKDSFLYYLLILKISSLNSFLNPLLIFNISFTIHPVILTYYFYKACNINSFFICYCSNKFMSIYICILTNNLVTVRPRIHERPLIAIPDLAIIIFPAILDTDDKFLVPQ